MLASGFETLAFLVHRAKAELPLSTQKQTPATFRYRPLQTLLEAWFEMWAALTDFQAMRLRQVAAESSKEASMRMILGALGAAWLTCAAAAQSQEVRKYPLTSQSVRQAAIPHGQLQGPFEFRSRLIPGTVRRYWVYVPIGYDPKRPPNLLLFQDGQRAINPQGSLRVQNVLDNLIARGDLPRTLGVFVTPGNLTEHYPDDLGMSNPNHRAQEYDALSDTYVRMLTDELLPQVNRRWAFSSDPRRRAIGGTSSGAIAAFTAAWHRPDAFGNVISFIGSYVSIGYKPDSNGASPLPGGDLYPTLIRKSPIRPIRIFLQDGSNDLDNEHGNWWLANQQMLAALDWANANAEKSNRGGARYEVEHVWGEGGHSDNHGGAILPDVLRWIWRNQRDR